VFEILGTVWIDYLSLEDMLWNKKMQVFARTSHKELKALKFSFLVILKKKVIKNTVLLLKETTWKINQRIFGHHWSQRPEFYQNSLCGNYDGTTNDIKHLNKPKPTLMNLCYLMCLYMLKNYLTSNPTYLPTYDWFFVFSQETFAINWPTLLCVYNKFSELQLYTFQLTISINNITAWLLYSNKNYRKHNLIIITIFSQSIDVFSSWHQCFRRDWACSTAK
jgi:hypothetical protein